MCEKAREPSFLRTEKCLRAGLRIIKWLVRAERSSKIALGTPGIGKTISKMASALSRKLMAKNTKVTGRQDSSTGMDECSGPMAQSMKVNGNSTSSMEWG